MDKKHEFRLVQEEAAFDKDGMLRYHPLIGPPQRPRSALPLRFASHGFESSKLLEDVKVFSVLFSGGEDERRSWANPIRSLIFKRLATDGYNWFINIDDRPYDDLKAHAGRTPVHTELLGEYLGKHNLQHVIFRDPRGKDLNPEKQAILVDRYGSIRTMLFFEVPNPHMEYVISNYWHRIAHGATAQGYLLPQGRIDYLQKWNLHTRDDHLFRRILDTVPYTFFTKGGEAQHLTFLTTMYSVDEFSTQIDVPDLRSRIRE